MFPNVPVIRGFLLLVLLSAPVFAQQGALTTQRDLSALVNQADRIFRGTVTSVKVEPHPQFKNLTTILVTMAVSETYKGQIGKTLQYRQYVWDAHDRLDVAGYMKGQELVLLLNPDSRYGLTSPAGMEQGRFRVLGDASGQVMAVNGRNNAGLFAGTEQQARARGVKLSSHALTAVRSSAPGPVALSDLAEVLRGFAGGAQ